MKRYLGIMLAAVVLLASSVSGEAQDIKAERRARKEQRKIEKAIRDSLRSVAAENDMVNLGYGKVKKKDLSMSVSEVDIDKKTIGSYSDMGSYLMGRVPGLTVTKTGDGYKYSIRSSDTIYGDTEPLFVVDGMAVDDISYLNPGDVEYVEVLKDAASASIYGTRGGNGVILITTKKR
jgi:TonB-dependent SusC/RagA subfamily outer membrane receptor